MTEATKAAIAALKNIDKNKFTFEFDPKDLSWVFIYKDGESETPVLFRFNKSLSNLSPSLIEKNLKWRIGVSLYLKDDKTGEFSEEPFTTLKLHIPNIFCDEDPHQILSADMTNPLYKVMMRESHGAWLQKLADMWQMDVAKKSNALDFNYIERKPSA